MFRTLLFIAFLSPLFLAAQLPAIIPQPVSMTKSSGSFTLTPATVLLVNSEDEKEAAAFFNSYLDSYYHIKLKTDSKASGSSIRIGTTGSGTKEGYTLTVSPKEISISGNDGAGSFYGMQTLIQLLPTEAGQSLQIPAVKITDYPRFAYRGMHLDVGRHFFSVDVVKKYIDYLALHKMNRFHWHLTEDQGWRIEIKKYPKLTTVGGFRNGTIVGHFPGTSNDDQRSGGFYTQEEVKDIVRYAAARYITIIPEIEMPGHGSAAIAAYPYLSCFPDEPTVIPRGMVSATSKKEQEAGRVKLVQESWGVFPDVFCAGKDSTFQFLQDVIDEVAPLFPSEYIHIGGDECPKDNWKRCPNCQKRIQELGLENEHELQSYFIGRMEKYINSKGKQIIGWDEILEGGLAPNATVMSWRGEKGGIEAAAMDHDVIMTPTTYVYFDYSQTKNDDSLTIGGFLPLDKVYNYEPYPKELDASKHHFIVGVQANLWTEYIDNPSKIEYMVFPRMDALSEVQWSPADNKDYDEFLKRLDTQVKRYKLWKTSYSKAAL